MSQTDAKKDHCLSPKLLLMFLYIDFVAGGIEAERKKGKGEDCVYVKSGIAVFFDKSEEVLPSSSILHHELSNTLIYSTF